MEEACAAATDALDGAAAAGSSAVPAAAVPPAGAESSKQPTTKAAAAAAGQVGVSDYAAADSSEDDDDEEEAAPANLDELVAALERRLALGDDSGKELLSRLKREPVLASLDLPGVAELIGSGRAKRIIVMCGAGISVSAGIPDFRTPGSGLYSQLEAYGLPEPEAVFSISFFRKNPRPFYRLAKELFPGNFRPTPAHFFMRLLHDKGLLLRCYSQNIDTMERQAGLPASAVVAAHGNFDSAHCIGCGRQHSMEHVKAAVFSDEICVCERCGSYVKPDIVFFGEQLPDRFYERMEADFPACDLLLVMGTSLVVHPFASLVDAVPDACPRVLINRERVGEARRSASSYGALASLLGISGGGGGFVFPDSDGGAGGGADDGGAHRDVLVLGDADDAVRQLADLLGWRQDLEALIASASSSSSSPGDSASTSSSSTPQQPVDYGSSAPGGGAGQQPPKQDDASEGD